MRGLTCDHFEALLGDHVEGVLGSDERIAFEDHLAGCSRCKQLHTEYTDLRASLRASGNVEMPADAKARLRRLLVRARRPPS
jgi:anti-sigma factor RsiW